MGKLIALVVLSIIFVVVAEWMAIHNRKVYNNKDWDLKQISAELLIIALLSTSMCIYTSVTMYKGNISLLLVSIMPIIIAIIIPIVYKCTKKPNKTKMEEHKNAKV